MTVLTENPIEQIPFEILNSKVKKYLKLIEPNEEECLDAWVNFIDVLKQNQEPHLIKLLMAIRDYKNEEYDKERKIAWKMVFESK